MSQPQGEWQLGTCSADPHTKSTRLQQEIATEQIAAAQMMVAVSMQFYAKTAMPTLTWGTVASGFGLGELL